MKVLVTGAAGFIGSHTCERLAAAGHQVWGVDDLSNGKVSNLAGLERTVSFRFEQLDIVTPSLDRLVERVAPDVVVHLAAQMDVRKSVTDPLADARTNVLGTVRLLTACAAAGTGRVVFASSGGTVYGEPAEVPVAEDAALRPLSPYGAAKVAGEAYVTAFAGLYSFRSCILALGNVYGPRQDPHGEAGVVAIFGRALLHGEETHIYGEGDAVRDYVYVADVVEAFYSAIRGLGDGSRYNVGTARGTTVRALHTLLAEAVGVEDAPTFRRARVGELNRIVLAVDAAERDLGWRPTTTLEAGIASTVDWLRGNLYV